MEIQNRTPLYIGIIILILLLAGITFYQRSVGDPYIANNTISDLPNDDSDNDGLKNWEETLWKTNPNNPDSDRDGSSDGEEVSLGRDPLLSGPDDYLGGVLFDGSNTNNLAIGLLSSYVESTQSESPNLNTQDIVRRALETKIVKPLAISYEAKDLILRGSSVNDYKEYGNSFAGLFTYFEDSPDEIKIVTTAMQSNDPQDLADLDIVVKNYQSFLANLLTLPAPQEMSEEHLLAINSFSKLIADINGMKLLFDDTIIATDSIANYQINAQSVQLALASIIQKIIASGAEYSTDEIGYGLVNVL